MHTLQRAWVIGFALFAAACAIELQEQPPTDGASHSVASAGKGGSAGGGGSGGASLASGSGGQLTAAGSGASGASAGGASGGGGSSAGTSAAGSAGTAGSSAAGSSGSGGSGGSGGTVSSTGECAANPSFRIDYQTQTADSSVTVYFHVYNESGAAVPISSLEVRYYISAEETTWNNQLIYTAQRQGPYENLISTTQIAVTPLAAAATNATDYVKLTYTGSSAMLGSSASEFIEMGINLEPNYDPPNQDETNDYSYDPAHSSYAAWDKITVYKGGVHVAGCEPPPL